MDYVVTPDFVGLAAAVYFNKDEPKPWGAPHTARPMALSDKFNLTKAD